MLQQLYCEAEIYLLLISKSKDSFRLEKNLILNKKFKFILRITILIIIKNVTHFQNYWLVGPLRMPEVYNEHNTTNIDSFL